MQIFKKIALATIVTVSSLSAVSVSSLSAHSLWVNSFESFEHSPGHTTVGIGWGHTMPIDDMPNSVNGKVKVESFTITTPNGKVVKLKLPNDKIEDPSIKTDELEVYNVE